MKAKLHPVYVTHSLELWTVTKKISLLIEKNTASSEGWLGSPSSRRQVRGCSQGTNSRAANSPHLKDAAEVVQPPDWKNSSDGGPGTDVRHSGEIYLSDGLGMPRCPPQVSLRRWREISGHVCSECCPSNPESDIILSAKVSEF